MASFFATLFALLLATAPAVLAARCSHSSHCATANPATIDMCSPRHGLCMSLPHPSFRQDTPDPEVIPTTLQRLINDTNAIDFTLADKIETIETVKKVYNGFNPHKFLHENLLGIDFPAALDAIEVSEDTTNVDFFDQMVNTFQLMDDKHSVYLLPYPFNSSLATLGFFTKIFYDKDSDVPMKRRYAVRDAIDGILPEGSSFGLGSEILTFNGKPIDQVIIALGKQSFGSNDAAQIDSALDLLSFRVLIGEQIPFEPSAEIGYVNQDGKEDTVTIDWFFAEIRDSEMVDTMMRQFVPAGRGPFHKKKPTAKFNSEKKKKPVGPETLNSNVRVVEEGRIPIEIDPALAQRFSAEVLSTKNGPIGRFVLPDFGSEATPELIAEIARVLKLMPKNGLIMDLRANGGGDPNYVKVLVESLVGQSPPQSPFVLRATQILKDGFDEMPSEGATEEELDIISAYSGAVGTALKIGEPFSGPSAGLYSPEFLNSTVERAYFGPIITLIDGLCYSAGDLFTSLQKDLDYSLVVGVSDNVGAGGASTLSYEGLREFFPTILGPISATFTTSFARFYRSGQRQGTIIENFGVKPDIRYYSTYDDVVKKDCDLYEFLGEKLQELKDGDGMGPGASPEAEMRGEPVSPSPEEIM